MTVVLTALIAVIGTLGGAWLTQRGQRRLVELEAATGRDRRAWEATQELRREQRRACADFVDACNQGIAANSVSRTAHELLEHRKAVSRAAARVTIYMPDDVAAYAQELADAYMWRDTMPNTNPLRDFIYNAQTYLAAQSDTA